MCAEQWAQWQHDKENIKICYTRQILYLLHWSVSLEENMSTEQLRKNTANRPHVYSHCVVTSPHQNLWRSIVLCHDFACHWHAVVRLNDSSQSKVTYLNTAMISQVIWRKQFITAAINLAFWHNKASHTPVNLLYHDNNAYHTYWRTGNQ